MEQKIAVLPNNQSLVLRFRNILILTIPADHDAGSLEADGEAGPRQISRSMLLRTSTRTSRLSPLTLLTPFCLVRKIATIIFNYRLSSDFLDVPRIRSPNSYLALVVRSRAGTDTAGPVGHLGRNYLSNDTYILKII